MPKTKKKGKRKMLRKKILIEGKTIVDDVEVAVHSAIINTDGEECDVSFTLRQLDKEACKQHREAVRADRAEIEDFAYKLQDELMASV